MLNSIVVTKWLEPYVILETFKKYFDCEDVTFDGFSKQQAKTKLFNAIEKSQKFAVGLYLKNVNKFYILTRDEKLNLTEKILEKEFQISQNDYEKLEDSELAISKIDLAKAEFSIIIKNS
ncbi:hypothetical protein J6E39_06145 [bacterium]|nr:hypothetical protein [bacterium]